MARCRPGPLLTAPDRHFSHTRGRVLDGVLHRIRAHLLDARCCMGFGCMLDMHRHFPTIAGIRKGANPHRATKGKLQDLAWEVAQSQSDDPSPEVPCAPRGG